MPVGEGLSSSLIETVVLSMKVAFFALCWVMPLAIWVAWVLAKKQFFGKTLVSAIVHLPLVMPPVVTGYLLLLGFGPQGPIGQFLLNWFGVEFGFRWTGAALAAGVMALPLIVRPLRVSFEAVDRELENVAQTLGAGRLRVFATVSLPLALPGLLAGMMLGFAKALGEFGATITFVSNIPGETRTLSLAVYSLLQRPDGDQQALILIGIAISISFVAILISELLANRIARKHRS